MPANESSGRAVAAALALCVSAATAHAASDTSIYWRDDLRQLIHVQEAKGPRIDAVLPELDIRPGLTVLDIGAGTGQQAVRIAELLRGSGRVYATDISPMLVTHINETAKRRGLSNLVAVQVARDGFDAFYGARRYDRILLYNVFYHLREQNAFVARLKALLAPGGRVVVVDPESRTRSFSREDFSDFDGFLDDLRREPAGTFLDRRLRRPLLAYLDGKDADMRERAVLHQFNNLLYSDLFAQEPFSSKPAPGCTEAERPYYEWSLRRMSLAGYPGVRSISELDKTEIEELRMLNKLALIARYRRRLRTDAPAPYHSADRVTSALDPDAIALAFEGAGFTLRSKRPLVPFEAVWVFGTAP